MKAWDDMEFRREYVHGASTEELVDAPINREYVEPVIRRHRPLINVPHRYFRVTRNIGECSILRVTADGEKAAAIVMIPRYFRPARAVDKGDELSIIGRPRHRRAIDVAAES